MDPYERSKLGDAVKEEKFKQGDYIIRQGQSGDKFYFINSGTAIATKNNADSKEETKVMDYESGAYFGERALLTNDVRAANIVATASEVVCLTLERDTFVRILGPLDEIPSATWSSTRSMPEERVLAPSYKPLKILD